MAPPSYWSRTELTALAAGATANYRGWRALQVAIEQGTFAGEYSAFRKQLVTLLAATGDLTNLTTAALAASSAPAAMLDVARYLPAAPLSLDDLDAQTGMKVGAWIRRKKPVAPPAGMLAAALGLIVPRIPPLHAPWLSGGAPTAQQRTRLCHTVASIRASQRVGTERRATAAQRQETATRLALAAAGYVQVTVAGALNPATVIAAMTPPVTPNVGSYLQSRKTLAGKDADVLVRMTPKHATGVDLLIIECKVSATELNSRKRINDVVEKVAPWQAGGLPGAHKVAAVLDGEFRVSDLERAQSAGIWLFFEHQLGDLTTLVV
jgi:hypothetical protein